MEIKGFKTLILKRLSCTFPMEQTDGNMLIHDSVLNNLMMIFMELPVLNRNQSLSKFLCILMYQR